MKKTGSRTGGFLARNFNLRRWADFDRLHAYTRYLSDTIKKLFIPQHKKSTETFSAAVKRLKLSQSDLAKKRIALLRLAVLMLVIFFILFGYFVYQLFFGTLLAIIISCVVMLMALTLAFRYHFWSFQITQRKLGCSLKEWFYNGILGGKK